MVYVHRDLTGLCILPKGLSTVFCVQEKFQLSARVCLLGTSYYHLGRWDRGFWLSNVASLVMYCIAAPQRIVTKPPNRTALPFSIHNARSLQEDPHPSGDPQHWKSDEAVRLVPVVLLSSWPPWPRSSWSAWITIVRPKHSLCYFSFFLFFWGQQRFAFCTKLGCFTWLLIIPRRKGEHKVSNFVNFRAL